VSKTTTWGRALGPVFLLVLVSIHASASYQKITGYKMTTCSQSHCTVMTSKSASRSSLDPSLLAFPELKIEIFQKSPKRLVKSYSASKGGYYNSSKNELTLRGTKKAPNGELLVNLENRKERLYSF